MKAFVFRHFTPFIALAAALGSASACSGGDTTSGNPADGGGSSSSSSSSGGSSDSGGGGISFATAVYPILTANCVGCHGHLNPIDMSVSASDARGRLVNQPAPSGVACASSTEKLVTPGNSAMSILYSKVSAPNPVCGARMPLGSALPATDQTTIKDWIDEGAQP
jgi:hypothetical protein